MAKEIEILKEHLIVVNDFIDLLEVNLRSGKITEDHFKEKNKFLKNEKSKLENKIKEKEWDEK